MMNAKGAIVPVADVMNKAGLKFDPSVYVPAVAGYYTAPNGCFFAAGGLADFFAGTFRTTGFFAGAFLVAAGAVGQVLAGQVNTLGELARALRVPLAELLEGIDQR